MAIGKSVYKWERIVLVRFSRAVNPGNATINSGPPHRRGPDMDDRGYSGTDHGPIVGILQGENIAVRLTRVNIENGANLFITSTDTNVVTILSPSSAVLPNNQRMIIRLHGVNGGNPRTAKIEVRFNSATGPVIHELTVWVLRRLRVRITPHLVTIAQTGSAVAAIGSIANVNAIINIVRAIWLPCGITFSVGAIQNDAVSFATAGIVSDNPFPGEINNLFSTNWVANTVNAYFVNQIGTGRFLGYGISRASATAFGVANPGIVLADRTAGSARAGTLHWANDLAHEIGHFFRLWHPENRQPPNELEDTWSRRRLMHNFNLMRGHNPWPQFDGLGNPYKYRPLLDDVDYGNLNRGCLITMKNLSQLNTDGECTTARNTISSVAGPY